MSGAPRLTVAVPTRNRAGMLREALTSALDQSLSDIEVIVSDNASDDDTAAVAASFDDPRVRYTRLESNIGLHGNLSRALHLGTAPYVTILQDDDFLLPGGLAAKVAVLDRRPEVAVVHSRFHYVDVSGKVVRPDVDWTGRQVDAVESGPLFLSRAMAANCRINLTSAVVRRSAVEGQAFDPSDGAQADVGLWLRVALRGAVAFVPETLSVRRVHAAAHSFSHGLLVERGAATQATPAHLDNVARVKERFLREHAEELGDQLGRLRAIAARAPRRQRLWLLQRELGGAPSRAVAAGQLWALLRHDPAVVREPRAWLLGAAVAVGPRRGAALLRPRGGH